MNSAEVVIVGGGVVGAAVLAALATRGVRGAVLLEKGRFADGATGRSGGVVRVYHPHDEVTALAAESFEAFAASAGRPESRVGFTRTGVLYLESAARFGALREQVARLDRGAWGLELEVLDADELGARFPALELRGVGGAVYEPRGGYADPVGTTHEWIERARACGAVACEGVQATRVLVESGRVAGVLTSVGPIRAPTVVLATGAWGAQLLAPLGIVRGIRSRSIQVYFFERPGPGSAHPVVIDGTSGVWARSASGGTSLVGASLGAMEVDPDAREPIDRASADATRAAAAQRLPWLAHARLVGGRRGFDGFTSEGAGVIERVAEMPGLVLAMGFSGAGFKTAPAVARRVADLLS